MRNFAIFVLDRSGSMAPGWNDVIASFMDLAKEIRESGVAWDFAFVVFNHEVKFLASDRSLDENLSSLLWNIRPEGMTALLDAVGRTIDDMGNYFSKLSHHEKPGKVKFFVFTDGYENASSDYTLPQIKEKMSHQASVYGWDFIIQGTDGDITASAVSTLGADGIAKSSSYGTSRTLTAAAANMMINDV